MASGISPCLITKYEGKLALKTNYVSTDTFVVVKDLLIDAKSNIFLNTGHLVSENLKVFSKFVVNQNLITSKFNQYSRKINNNYASGFVSQDGFIRKSLASFCSKVPDLGFYNFGNLDVDNIRTEDLKANVQGNVNVKSWVSDQQIRLGRSIDNDELDQDSKTDYCYINEISASYVTVDAQKIDQNSTGGISSTSGIWNNFAINKLILETPILAVSNKIYPLQKQSVDLTSQIGGLSFDFDDGFNAAQGHYLLTNLIADESYRQRPMQYWLSMHVAGESVPRKMRIVFMGGTNIYSQFFYNEEGLKYDRPSGISISDSFYRQYNNEDRNNNDSSFNELADKLWDEDLAPFIFSKIRRYEDVARTAEVARQTLLQRLKSAKGLSADDEKIRQLIEKYALVNRKNFDLTRNGIGFFDGIDFIEIDLDVEQFYNRGLPKDSRLRNEFYLGRDYLKHWIRAEKSLSSLERSLSSIFNAVDYDAGYTMNAEKMINILKSEKFRNDIKQEIAKKLKEKAGTK